MLEEIHIGGHSKGTLQKILEARPGELHGIIITNHSRSFPDGIADKMLSHIHLVFDDINHKLSPAHVMPAREHIEAALEFAKDKKAVVVACHAGVSRSSAIAYLIASRAWGVKPALGALKKGTHWPNPTVIKIGDTLFPGEGIMETVMEWTNNNSMFLIDGNDPPLCDVPVEIEEIKLK